MNAFPRSQGYVAERGSRPGPATGPPDELVLAYLPLVKKVVRRLAIRKPPHIEVDDLVSWGVVGLLDALKKYDAKKQARFETYAQLRIRGAILDRLRDMDWVSRSVREKANLLDKTYRQLEASHRRPATEEEVALALDMTLPELHELLSEVGQRSMFSFDDLGIDPVQEPRDLESILDGESPDPIQALLSRERVDLVADAISRLPEKERTVIALYYHEEITMKEVAAVLDLTESRVSQLHSQALLRIRGLLREHFGKERRK